ncbi:DNA-3-methyladenine glycosylase I [Apilactobacillus apisilvae]|uniref:DNA-3-methyladenine glycosylase I n=1 Tax=Apilactobacillus apisilvae TaxID=2923364 RepID=A0ABY4PI73_9LACO|nr:DNA-3-methyladenine glycosylase I [Apilactobacillus apisilvae]UQS85161.1 DNA-3-methyladenine glycosylase I [Apilactobacillus apisilvae]
MVQRCNWSTKNNRLLIYHDNEWGRPIFDSQKLFEILSLEILQAGLCWTLILSKRDSIVEAFDYFDFKKISAYDNNQLEKLINNKNIIRNKDKIEAIIFNAKLCNSIDLSSFIWEDFSYCPLNHLNESNEIPLYEEFIHKYVLKFKHYGFKRIGSKTLYSFYQAVGVVNDHEIECFYNKS